MSIIDASPPQLAVSVSTPMQILTEIWIHGVEFGTDEQLDTLDHSKGAKDFAHNVTYLYVTSKSRNNVNFTDLVTIVLNTQTWK